MVKAYPLDHLPPHIIEAVVANLAEKELWRMMAMSRTLREFAQVALRPFLVEKRIAVEPALVPDLSIPIDPLFTHNHSSRGDQLERISSLFTSHLTAYPSSSSSLRRLTVEVRDDDVVSGCEHVQRFAQQLEALELHMYDRLWRKTLTGQLGNPIDMLKSRRAALYASNIWSRVLRAPFPILTSLTLAATARVSDHFWALAPMIPNLQELTLSCHWNSLGMYADADGPLHILAHLRRFTLNGSKAIIAKVLHELLPAFPNLHSLILHPADQLSGHTIDADLTQIAQTLLATELRICHLSVFGPNADLLLAAISCFQRFAGGNSGDGLDHVVTLELQQRREPDDFYSHVERLVLLKTLPLFPLLRHITLVLDHIPPSPMDKELVNSYRTEYQGLFAFYHTLEEIQWVKRRPERDLRTGSAIKEANVVWILGRDANDRSRRNTVTRIPQDQAVVPHMTVFPLPPAADV